MSENQIYRETAAAFRHIDFSRLFGKSLLVTGATGLIGSYLLETVRWLNREKGADIQLLILSHNGLPSHLTHFSEIPWATILTGDLSDGEWRRKLPATDFMIHAAGYGQPGKFTSDPAKTLALNTAATLDLLDRLRSGGSFLFISTSELYSGLQKSAYTEGDIGTTTPMHPRACYIEGKRCGETACMAYRLRGVDAKCARLALAYGPGTRADDKRVMNEFIKKALIDRKIRMLDSGKAMRTYCYVTDAVEYMWQILLHGTEPVYNVGGHSETSIAGLAKEIGEITGAAVEFPPADKDLIGAPASVRLDMNKAEKEFQKTDYVSLYDGLTRTIAWQQGWLYGGMNPAQSLWAEDTFRKGRQ